MEDRRGRVHVVARWDTIAVGGHRRDVNLHPAGLLLGRRPGHVELVGSPFITPRSNQVFREISQGLGLRIAGAPSVVPSSQTFGPAPDWLTAKM